MPVIWGLDLKDIQWSAFKSSNMWSNTYHLRRTKFLVYQGAMIFCVVSESLGTDALSDYVSEQKNIQHDFPGANIQNNDIVGSFSYNIFAGVFVATIFGAAFFFDLFWPLRKESKSVRLAWKICSVLAVIFVFASALNLTIILATHRAILTGVVGEQVRFKPVLVYKKNGEAIASVVLVWIGWLFTMWSCYLMFISNDHIAAHGALSKAGRAQTGNGAIGTPAVKDGTDENEKKSIEDAP